MKNYYKALAGFQQECPVLLKDTDGYGYKYVDLTKIIHSINPLMQKHGLGFTQMLGTNPESGNTCVTTTIFHIESGENNSSTVDVPLVEMKGQNSYQSIGSGCSYFKRYQLSSALGIVSDKDTDAYGDQVKTNAKKQLDLGPTKKVVPKKDVTVVNLDIGDDSLYEVLHKVIKYRDEGNSFEKIIGDLKKKYDFNITTEKHIKDIYDGETK
tara:strand:+ start:1750 stop:2382 length:633 start_codon:yes stop_codon:yes gene_type:complete